MIIRLPTVNGAHCFVRGEEKWGEGLIYFLLWLGETGVAPFLVAYYFSWIYYRCSLHISSGSKLCCSCSGILTCDRTTQIKRFNCAALLNFDGLCGFEEAVKHPSANKVFQADRRWMHPLFTNRQRRGELKGRNSCQRTHPATDMPCGKFLNICLQPM